MICQKCKSEVVNGFYCEESDKAWCSECHKDLNIDKHCFKYFKQYSKDKTMQKLHFHHKIENGEIIYNAKDD